MSVKRWICQNKQTQKFQSAFGGYTEDLNNAELFIHRPRIHWQADRVVPVLVTIKLERKGKKL